MEDNEKRRWLRMLRTVRYPRHEEEKKFLDQQILELADQLEQQWFPKPGRPKRSSAAVHHSWVETLSLAREVSAELLKLKAEGGCCGGVKSAAMRNIAKRHGCGYEGLRKRLNGFDLEDDFFTGKNRRPWAFSKIVFRGREISGAINEAEEKVRIEQDKAEYMEILERRRSMRASARQARK